MTDAELDILVDSLSLEDQILLLSGSDNWHTHAIPSAGIPAMRVSDGPAGARGTSFTGPESVNVPCGTSLAATFDPALIEEIGQLLGRETRAKGARVLLAPTVNLHRTPVGGRNFECQTEDPFLCARITVGYIRGVQSEGVAACVKHFVGNDTEFERMTIDSQIDERTLREMYLQPFEAAVKEAGVLSVMTAYNRINGPYAADSKELITDILRNEWGFNGIVMSDWFGLHSTVEAIEAGLDLEMPGPPRERGDRLLEAVNNGLVDSALIRAAARRMVGFLDHIGAITDGGPGPELTRDEPEDRILVRTAGAAGMVLLRNENGALPLTNSATKSVAVIGPNAANGRIMGGGSAMVNAVHEVHPLDSLTTRLGALGIDVRYAPGCRIHRTLPAPERRLMSNSTIAYWATSQDMATEAPPVLATELPRFHLMWPESPGEGLSRKSFAARIRTILVPDVSGEWTFGLTSVGDARLILDGSLLFDDHDSTSGGSFFGLGKHQVTAVATLVAGRSYELIVEYENSGIGFMRGLIIGLDQPLPADLIGDAARLAATTDTAIIVVGTNDDWESEGYDRSNIDLPGDQDELIREVAKVSPRTIVVVNAGSPVAMPWLDAVDAVLFVWFPGQEFGDALSDVLLGDVDPGGRLPVTLPRRFVDSPALEHHPGRNGVARYLEGRLMGYRWYDTTGRDPLFPFGHGLSYADISIDSAVSTSARQIQVQVRNASECSGTEVVQVYVHDPVGTGAADDAEQHLVGFTKLRVPAGATLTATVEIDERWASHWDVKTHSWKVNPGARELRVGSSSRAISHTLHVEVA
jgi:beta-glucosidase